MDAGIQGCADQGRGSSMLWELLPEQQGHVAVNLPGTGRGHAIATVDIIVSPARKWGPDTSPGFGQDGEKSAAKSK